MQGNHGYAKHPKFYSNNIVCMGVYKYTIWNMTVPYIAILINKKQVFYNIPVLQIKLSHLLFENMCKASDDIPT